MSMDFPDYVQIRKKSIWLGFLWRTGDLLYYIGLFGFIFTAIGTPMLWIENVLTHRRVGINPSLPIVAAMLTAFVFLFFCGPRLKEYSRRSAGVE